MDAVRCGIHATVFTHKARSSNVKTFLGRVNNGVFELTSINPSFPQSSGLARASLIAMPGHGVLQLFLGYGARV